MVFPRLGKEISRGGLIVAREVQQLQREAQNVLDAHSPGQTPIAQRQTCAAAKSSMAQKRSREDLRVREREPEIKRTRLSAYNEQT